MFTGMKMRRFVGAAAMAALLAGTMTTMPFASEAQAQSWRYHGGGYYGYDRGYRPRYRHHNRRHYSYRRDNDAAVAAGIIGLGAGLALGSALSQPPVYSAPPPTYGYGYYRAPTPGYVDPSEPVLNY